MPIREFFIQNSLRIIPDDNKWTHHSVYSIIIALPLALIYNFISSEQGDLSFAVGKSGTQLERLFWQSMTEKVKKEKLLLITLKNRKVYVGYAHRVSNPIGDVYISIIPSLSGYRNSENLTIHFETNYGPETRKLLREKDGIKKIGELMGIVIPKDEIMTATRYDNSIFKAIESKSTDSD